MMLLVDISSVGSIIMMVFDGLINGMIDFAGSLASFFGSTIAGFATSSILNKFVDKLGTRDKAEFIAYNWYYLRFVDWSKI